MSKVIKYKIWEKKSKTMLKEKAVLTKSGFCVDFSGIPELKDFELVWLLYTDAHTDYAEICEGDIVKFEYEEMEYIGVVRLESTMFIICSNDLPDSYIPLFDVCESDGDTTWFEGEIIGDEYTSTVLRKQYEL